MSYVIFCFELSSEYSAFKAKETADSRRDQALVHGLLLHSIGRLSRTSRSLRDLDGDASPVPRSTVTIKSLCFGAENLSLIQLVNASYYDDLILRSVDVHTFVERI